MDSRRAICLYIILWPLAWTQTKPNFSGTWKLNVTESDYSDKRAAVPDRLVWTLQLNGDHLKFKVESERQGKKGAYHVDTKIGGEPFESDEAGIVSAKWKGDSLAIDTLYNPGKDRESSMEEMWTLSPDGKRLTDKVVYHLPKTAKSAVDVQFTRVFEKQ